MKIYAAIVLLFLIATEAIFIGFFNMDHGAGFAPWDFIMGGLILGLAFALVVQQIMDRKKQ